MKIIAYLLCGIILVLLSIVLFEYFYEMGKDKPEFIDELKIDRNAILITDYFDEDNWVVLILTINSTEDTIYYNNEIYVKQ